MATKKTVSQFIRSSKTWQNELTRLRQIVQETGLTETIKWGMPCYTYRGKNVVGLARFNKYFGLWFHQGALIDDTHNKLINAQEGKTKALRQWRMTHQRDIKPTIIKRYIKACIANIDQGNEIKPAKKARAEVPKELQQALANSRGAQSAFQKLSDAKQREYARYVSDAKQEATRLRRVTKILPLIKQGAGLNDRYR